MAQRELRFVAKTLRIVLIWTGALVQLCLGSKSAFAQNAMVTFYSHGSILTTGIPETKRDVYCGNVFDGSQGLFTFRDGHWDRNDRFITLVLASGPHTFGASNGKRPEPRETLKLDLKPGEHYFIRAQGESVGVPLVFTLQHGRLDLMSCTDARPELAKAKSLKDRGLWRYTRALRSSFVVDETSPPACR